MILVDFVDQESILIKNALHLHEAFLERLKDFSIHVTYGGGGGASIAQPRKGGVPLHLRQRLRTEPARNPYCSERNPNCRNPRRPYFPSFSIDVNVWKVEQEIRGISLSITDFEPIPCKIQAFRENPDSTTQDCALLRTANPFLSLILCERERER